MCENSIDDRVREKERNEGGTRREACIERKVAVGRKERVGRSGKEGAGRRYKEKQERIQRGRTYKS
jgi:hypothetical protein